MKLVCKMKRNFLIVYFLNRVFHLLTINKIIEFRHAFDKYPEEIISENDFVLMNKICIREHEIQDLKNTIKELTKQNNDRAYRILEAYSIKNGAIPAKYENECSEPKKPEFKREKCVVDKRVYETVIFYKGRKIEINWFFKYGLNKLYDVLDYEQKAIEGVFDSFHEKIQILMRSKNEKEN